MTDRGSRTPAAATRPVRVPVGPVALHGDFGLPPKPLGLILFAHGSGSSRHSFRNQFVARVLERHGFATLLIDLLTESEEAIDQQTAHLRFDIGLLAARLVAIVDWLGRTPETAGLPIGLFGASTGAAAALQVAAEMPQAIAAVVSRGGRPDLAGEPALRRVRAPTLLIVGGDDHGVIELNQAAHAALGCVREIAIVPGATHLFEERGTLEEVARLAAAWFSRHLAPRA
jgi:putative phosphoribosyl transferase